MRSPNQEPATKTPVSLNPFAPGFEGIAFPRPEESYFPFGIETNECYRNQGEGFVHHGDGQPNKTSVGNSLFRLADILSRLRLQNPLPLPEPELSVVTYSITDPVWLKSFGSYWVPEQPWSIKTQSEYRTRILQ